MQSPSGSRRADQHNRRTAHAHSLMPLTATGGGDLSEFRTRSPSSVAVRPLILRQCRQAQPVVVEFVDLVRRRPRGMCPQNSPQLAGRRLHAGDTCLCARTLFDRLDIGTLRSRSAPAPVAWFVSDGQAVGLTYVAEQQVGPGTSTTPTARSSRSPAWPRAPRMRCMPWSVARSAGGSIERMAPRFSASCKTRFRDSGLTYEGHRRTRSAAAPRRLHRCRSWLTAGASAARGDWRRGAARRGSQRGGISAADRGRRADAAAGLRDPGLRPGPAEERRKRHGCVFPARRHLRGAIVRPISLRAKQRTTEPYGCRLRSSPSEIPIDHAKLDKQRPGVHYASRTRCRSPSLSCRSRCRRRLIASPREGGDPSGPVRRRAAAVRRYVPPAGFPAAVRVVCASPHHRGIITIGASAHVRIHEPECVHLIDASRGKHQQRHGRNCGVAPTSLSGGAFMDFPGSAGGAG